MFNNFLSFVNVEEKKPINNVDDFLLQYGGKSFLNGLYRLFAVSDIPKWNEVVENAFPKYKNIITVFGFDWLGRIFAVNKTKNSVIFFEPGTGEVFDTEVGIVEFHNDEIPEYHEDCLASRFFEDWYEANGKFVLPHNKCAGYKVPLFLNGEDVIDNLEVSDMEVYWKIMMPLINL